MLQTRASNKGFRQGLRRVPVLLVVDHPRLCMASALHNSAIIHAFGRSPFKMQFQLKSLTKIVINMLDGMLFDTLILAACYSGKAEISAIHPANRR